MNIFVTSPDPVACARYLDTIRVNKMVTETAQILSTAANTCAGKQVATYKSYNPNHPVVLWAMRSRGNYFWLYAHFVALCKEYIKRRKRYHKSYIKCLNELANLSDYIPQGQRTEFLNASKNHKHIPDVFEAYKLDLKQKCENDVIKLTWD